MSLTKFLLIDLMVVMVIMATVDAHRHHNSHHHHNSEPNKTALETSLVVPDVIEAIPAQIVKIKYTGTNVTVNLGNALNPTDVQQPPVQMSWRCSKDRKLYAVVMVDPAGGDTGFRHWLMVNVPGDDLARGETCNEYLGAMPPQGQSPHRYVFVVYEQPGRFEDENKICGQAPQERAGFSAKNFAKEYNLKPVAANFFLSENK